MIDLEDIKNNFEIFNAREEFINSFKSNDKVVTLDNDYIKDNDFRNLIKSRGSVIYLKSSPYTIYNNIKNEYNKHRFNQKNFNEEFITKKYNELENLYIDMATYTVNIDYIKIENVFSKVLAIFNYINRVHCHIYFK